MIDRISPHGSFHPSVVVICNYHDSKNRDWANHDGESADWRSIMRMWAIAHEGANSIGHDLLSIMRVRV